jgi:hypothetical protein
MDSSALKGLEFLVIIGAVAWFYVSQQQKLKKLKAEREAKHETAETSGAKVEAEKK